MLYISMSIKYITLHNIEIISYQELPHVEILNSSTEATIKTTKEIII
jgi:hypothetical protein